ncbi:hypothetical protein [Streptomyces sp. CC219B]|uniref:hypothetical protein n=1 Tax=Streptomyces sp. CC219B TaxID=3044574 RepID=UPI0024A7B6CA|nr:hypothetical protein [Streptomyces sp. CC219B]
MNGAMFDPGAFRALIPSVPPSLISDFLDDSGWVLAERREGFAEYWLEPGSSGDPTGQHMLLLPLNEDMRDFKRRLAEVLAELGTYFNEDAPQLLQRISRLNWDTLLLSTEPPGRDDSVSLIHATRMLNAGMEMVRLAALYTFNPHRSSWGRNQNSKVMDYLREDVQLAHTERGSFVFPILSRIGPRDAGGSAFGRQVMANLAEALSRVHDWPRSTSRQGYETTPLDIAISKQLASAAEVPGFDRLNIYFRWAPARTLPPASPAASLDFDAHTIEAVKETAQRLQASHRKRPADDSLTDPFERPSDSRGWRSHTPRGPALSTQPPETRVSGRVISIGLDDRNTERNESPYFIILRTPQGDVWIPVTEDEYEFAMRARANNQNVTAVGKVTDRGGRRTLRGFLVRPEELPSPHRRR